MRSRRIMVLLTTVLVLGVGCASDPHRVDSRRPVPPPTRPAADYRPQPPAFGSLFTEAGSDMFTDLRARRVGDIIIVEIVENASAKKKNDTKAERTNEWKAGVPYFFGLAGGLRRESGSKNTDPLIQADFTSKHDAKSELKREDTMTASIGCTVVEVLPNGNLVIRGSREIEVNGETQYIVLEGVVRPVDVASDNTVKSTQIADAKIYYTGRGVLTDKQKPGWLARLLDHIWPF